ncbi:lipase, partial [Micrococcus sp. SIMBA_144]
WAPPVLSVAAASAFVLAGAGSALAGVFARTVVTPVRRHAESTPSLAVVDTPAGRDGILRADEYTTVPCQDSRTVDGG